MDYLHCPGCGQKALTVATRCPRCGMPFETRYAEHPASGTRRRRLPVWLMFAAAVVTVLAVNAVGRKLSRMAASRTTASDTAPTPTAAPSPQPPQPQSALATADSPPVTAAPQAAAPAESVSQTVDSIRPAPPSPPAPPAPSVTPAVEIVSASAERRFARTWVNVRAERNNAASVIKILRPGELVLVDLLQRGWYRVVAGQQALGYVDGRYLGTSPPEALP